VCEIECVCERERERECVCVRESRPTQTRNVQDDEAWGDREGLIEGDAERCVALHYYAALYCSQPFITLYYYAALHSSLLLWYAALYCSRA